MIYVAPPIVEAIVQFVFAEPLPAAKMRKAVGRLKRFYPATTDLLNVQAKINVLSRSAEFEDSPQSKLASDDQADAFIIEPGMCLWTRLAPYQGWDEFIARVKRDYEALLDVFGRRKLVRMGVRYINRFDIPAEVDGRIQYESYLAVNIRVPQIYPAVLNYGWRFEHEIVAKDLLLILQSATAEQVLPNTGAFLLDIDVIAGGTLPIKLDEIFAKLEEMRDVKNQAFETSITDKAREAFGK